MNPTSSESKHLSARQRALLQLIARGRTNDQIARQLGVSTAQVRHDISELMQQAQVSCRAHLVAWSYVHGPMDIEAWPPRAQRSEGHDR